MASFLPLSFPGLSATPVAAPPLTYSQTLDVEKSLYALEIARKDSLRHIESLYWMLETSGFADRLNTLAEALEESTALLDSIYDKVKARQDELERESDLHLQ